MVSWVVAFWGKKVCFRWFEMVSCKVVSCAGRFEMVPVKVFVMAVRSVLWLAVILKEFVEDGWRGVW